MFLACGRPYLAQAAPNEELAIAMAVFAYEVADQRRAEGALVAPTDIELDPRRLQWGEASDSVEASSTERLLSSWIRFEGYHPRAIIEEILKNGGAARTCESAIPDRVCRSKVDGAVSLAMSSPRFAGPDSAHVRVVLFSAVQEWRFMNSLALYLVTLRRSAQGWLVVSEVPVFVT
jgi:hypothetical protein